MFNSDLPADSSKIRYSAGYIRANFKAIEAALGPGLTIFPTGTRLWFYQDSAPTGWSIVTSLSDCLLGVVNTASGNTYSTAGAMSGTWQQSDHVLTEGQMPRHGHNFFLSNQDFQNRATYPYLGNNAPYNSNGLLTSTTNTTGDDQPHNHGDSWRPAAAVGIIAERM